MLKTFSKKTNFILIGIVVGLFIGVTVKQALGDTTTVPGTVRADNLTVNTSGQYTNGLIVANGNALVAGNIGVGTTLPSVKLDVVGDIKSSTKICIGLTCVDEGQLKTILGSGDVFSNVVAGWSGSASGPFTDNAQICNPGTVYQQITGVNKNSNPPLMGCAQPESSNFCNPYIFYTDSDWSNDTTIKTSLNVNTRDFPMQNYNLYLSIGGTMKKVLTGTLKACGSQYQWQYTRGTCVSPGPDKSSYPCNASRLGEEHDFGGCISTCVLK